MLGSPVRPAIEPRLTIRPPRPAAASAAPTARAKATAPSTLTRSTSSHSASGLSVDRAVVGVDAGVVDQAPQAAEPLGGGQRALGQLGVGHVAGDRDRGRPGELLGQGLDGLGRCGPPAPARPPRAPTPRATAAPIPREAPVTMTVRPSRRKGSLTRAAVYPRGPGRLRRPGAAHHSRRADRPRSPMLSFAFTEEQDDLRQMVREFAKAEVAPLVEEARAQREVPGRADAQARRARAARDRLPGGVRRASAPTRSPSASSSRR